MNPWLSIPLDDYEAHMALPEVGQAKALASDLGLLLQRYRPASLALLGCAGGNGLERVDPAVTRRVVAVDINPDYVSVTRRRFEQMFDEFEPIVCDISAMEKAPFAPVDLIFAGLLLEYVALEPALRFIRSGLKSGGMFGCVIQQESESIPRVSPSPFASLAVLASAMRIVSPQDIADAAARCDLRIVETRTLQMPNGKLFVSQLYAVS